MLHYTAGGSARSTFTWWQTGQPQRVATAYLVERDGTVFEVFDPRFWAFHLALAGTGGRVERHSIGIELASAGWLEERGGELLAFGGPFGGAVYDHGAPWREQHDGYPPAWRGSRTMPRAAISLGGMACTIRQMSLTAAPIGIRSGTRITPGIGSPASIRA